MAVNPWGLPLFDVTIRLVHDNREQTFAVRIPAVDREAAAVAAWRMSEAVSLATETVWLADTATLANATRVTSLEVA